MEKINEVRLTIVHKYVQFDSFHEKSLRSSISQVILKDKIYRIFEINNFDSLKQQLNHHFFSLSSPSLSLYFSGDSSFQSDTIMDWPELIIINNTKLSHLSLNWDHQTSDENVFLVLKKLKFLQEKGLLPIYHISCDLDLSGHKSEQLFSKLFYFNTVIDNPTIFDLHLVVTPNISYDDFNLIITIIKNVLALKKLPGECFYYLQFEYQATPLLEKRGHLTKDLPPKMESLYLSMLEDILKWIEYNFHNDVKKGFSQEESDSFFNFYQICQQKWAQKHTLSKF